MTDTPSSAPDLKDGFIVNGLDDANSFRTNVECVLKRTRKGKDSQFSYLSSECRAELVADTIFDGRFYEVCLLTTWDGGFSLRHGSYNYGFNPAKNAAGRMPETACVKWAPNSTAVRCRERPVELLSFDEAEGFVRDGPTNNIFMMIDWETDGAGYCLYAPCRYTNFPNPEKMDTRYLQPISGYVLVEFDGRFYLAYIAAHVTQEGTKTVEFICRDKISVIHTKPKTGAFFWLFSFLDRLLLNRVFVTDEFHKIVKVDGACTFFTYLDE